MPLPSIIHPIYKLTLPISKTEITYRPFIEKERKILLMALEANDPEDIMNVVLQILTDCLLTSDKEMLIENLTTVDAEYFFLHLRAKSVGEIVTLNFRCENETSNGVCSNIMQTDVDITTVTITSLPETNLVKLTPTIGVKMKYPSFKSLEQYSTLTGNTAADYIYELLANCIDYVVENETIYQSKDFTKDEILEFLLSLTTEQFHHIETFIDSLPNLIKVVHHKCSKCGFDHEITISGYQSFFV